MKKIITILFTFFFFSSAMAKTSYVLRSVTVHDGTGGEPFVGDILVEGERVTQIGTVKAPKGAKVIDGEGWIAAPGFIDLHTHSDLGEHSRTGEPVLLRKQTRSNLNFLHQGVTTVVTGNCGFGQVDVASFFKKLERGGIGTNVIHQLPHNHIRAIVMGQANRAPTPAELEKMKALVRKGMEDGAWGFTTGLFYTPGAFAKTDEVVALAKEAARFGGHYATHLRDEGHQLLASVEEAIAVGESAGMPVHISHLKADRPAVWGMSTQALALFHKARARGLHVTADQYPYTACSTNLADETIPPELRQSPPDQMRAGIEASLGEYKGGKTIRLADFPARRQWQGRDLVSLAAENKMSVVDLVLEIEKLGGAKTVNFSMGDEDVAAIMKEKFVATASDGKAEHPSPTVIHPRSYGTFPRKIHQYVVVDKTISMAHAIRSASGLPADILKLKDRGYLKVGRIADIVVFDPKMFRDTATFEKPHQLAVGVKHLFVNGTWVIQNEKYRGALAGKVLRRNSSSLSR